MLTIIVMNERIREFLIAENKSSAQLAEEIGVQPSGISHILSGRNNPSLDFVLKMLEKYHYISTDWLLFGKGTMYKENKMQSLFDGDIVENELHPVDSTDHNSESSPVDTQNMNLHRKLSNKVNVITAEVAKIVWFYSDNSFEEYYPNR